MSARGAWLGACGAWIALAFLCVAWELWLAPLRPGGSWLVLKALPLLLPLRGLLHGRKRAFQAATLLVWAYAAEGAVRAASDPGPSARVAVLEVALAFAFFALAVAYIRALRGSAQASK